jgi:hypothetical protein
MRKSDRRQTHLGAVPGSSFHCHRTYLTNGIFCAGINQTRLLEAERATRLLGRAGDMRIIHDILYFRGDISPFLVHLTRDNHGGPAASGALKRIIEQGCLTPGPGEVSDARFGMYTNGLDDEERRCLLCAVCFTETPLNEVHSLLEIAYRHVDLASYGLVFLKDRLSARGVSPVLYINNERGTRTRCFGPCAPLRGPTTTRRAGCSPWSPYLARRSPHCA